MVVTEPATARHGSPRRSPTLDRASLLRAGLFALRAGPALILLVLIVVVALTTPVFLTSRNIGNVFSQTSVIAVLALGQLLVIVTRGIDLSVGATVALSGVVGALVFGQTDSSLRRHPRDPRDRDRRRGASTALVFVYGRVPHPFIVTLATLEHRAGHRALGLGRDADLRDATSVQTIGGGTIDWLPYSIVVVAALALVCLLLTTRHGLGPLALCRRRQSRCRASFEHSRQARARHGVRAERPRRRGRRADHRRADQRRLAHDGRARRARLDRGGDHRRGGASRGGRGNVGNALVGAFTIGVIRNALNLHNVDAFYQLIVIGIVVLLAVEADVLRGAIERRVRVARAARLA